MTRRSDTSDMSAWLTVVALAFLLGFVAVTCWLALGVAVGASPPACAVDPQPRVTLAPLRYLRLRVTVEPSDVWHTADVILIDNDGVDARRSRAWDQSGGGRLAPRTTIVEWTQLALPDGEYRVVLIVTTAVDGRGCVATGRVIVAGGYRLVWR